MGVLLLLLSARNVALFFRVFIPVLVGLAGLILIAHGLRFRARGVHRSKDLLRGLSLVACAGVLYLFWRLYLVLLLILAAWFLSSAAVTLLRVYRVRGKLPQGVAYTLLLGLISIWFGVMAFTNPDWLVQILVMILGVVALLAGGFLFVDRWGMLNVARLLRDWRSSTDP